MEGPLARRLDYREDDVVRQSPRGERGAGSPSLVCATLSLAFLVGVIMIPLVLRQEMNSDTTDPHWTRHISQLYRSDRQSSERTEWNVLGLYGAVMISIITGIVIGLSTCVCMYYDSHRPGLEPPSPCSSPCHPSHHLRSSNIDLGYFMAKVNGLIGFAVTLAILLVYTTTC